ncbi:MAG: hypothetical protein KW806_03475 [Candidatus Yanofskybacteria bacterium]|nr:hypothetical protein [Candidatus Yanofskybacteria bacterium]
MPSMVFAEVQQAAWLLSQEERPKDWSRFLGRHCEALNQAREWIRQHTTEVQQVLGSSQITVEKIDQNLELLTQRKEIPLAEAIVLQQLFSSLEVTAKQSAPA